MTMQATIHPTAVVEPGARLGADVHVGPFCYIGDGVTVGDGCRFGPHCSVMGPTTIGSGNRFVGHCAVGGEPQDKKFAGEQVELIIGDRNTFREFVTLNRGTGSGGGVTRIGSDNWLLAYTHVAHDCVVGDHCVFSNNATLAGHVTVGDHVILSGFAGVHQFCRIGAHAFIGMGAFVNGDVPPFVMVAQDGYGRPRGINSEGLKRRGFDSARIGAIKRAYRALYVAGSSLDEARAKLTEMAGESADVRALLDFIDSAERPLLR
nr:acyl-ACP--UDP-N-acetylglucosamine O-acyltransferase [Lysobacter maris]